MNNEFATSYEINKLLGSIGKDRLVGQEFITNAMHIIGTNKGVDELFLENNQGMS